MSLPHDGDRVVALGRQLTQAHDELRSRLAAVRAGLGRRRLDDDSLVAHCLAFCAALTSHHRGEDAGLFPRLLHVRPDLAPAIRNLAEDHGLIASLLSRVAELAGRAASLDPGPALDAVGRELDGLAAIMESHFAYEERAIGAFLDQGVDGAEQPDGEPSGAEWRGMVFGSGTG
ncbi:hemerythrin domain-containing protein [Streptomyces caatingaensis]|uniref:Hemerythrin HHE cation-binding protein n=1 Tax=Streptomyces caatingaensis TaxID=1678637 RepID=A0A0K9XBI5_9ACTN|nr:hemerythrin domain-containing protein [Streptomyces caatingaensis]KNB50578.1 hemerythrin HHE cation-binding protein [Streptomyces caatingaensis]